MAKRKSAYFQALKETQNRETVKPSNREAVEQPDSPTVQQSSSTTVEQQDAETAHRNLAKTSFYIRPDQADKLDELAYNFRRQRGKRIDRQDIVRALIDSSSLDQILDLIH